MIVFDRLFGTFRAERPGGGLRYGLVHRMESKNPVRIAFHEWQNLFADMAHAPGIFAKLRVCAGQYRA